MGKASRLKRLRKLELQSQQTLIERVRRSMPDKPIKALQNPDGLEKMSEVLKDFAQPWLDLARTEEECARVIGLAIIAWNLALMPEEERFTDFDSQSLAALGEPGLELLRFMIGRKLALFEGYNRPILDYELTGNGDKLRLNVVSGVPNPEKFLGQAETE